MGPLARDVEENAGDAHVLVIPLTPQGHLSPMLSLATQLARKGIRVTFAVAEDAIFRLTAPGGGGSASEVEDLDFRFVPLRITGGQDLNSHFAFDTGLHEKAFEPVREQLLRDKSGGVAGRPTSIVSDMFQAWTQDLADELQIPRYMFVTSGVLFVKAMQGFLDYYNRGDFQISEADGKIVPFDWSVRIPGIPPMRYHEIPNDFDDFPEWRPKFESVGLAAGLLVNSFYELEENVIETWKRVGNPGFQHIKVPKLYPVGPLFSTSNVKAPPRGLDDSASKCLDWLGSQPSSSVLYIAFGSHLRLGPEEIHEMALGLESSQQRFLWVIPQQKESSEKDPSASISEILPPGFEARLADRCCIVTGWAPQLEILAHSATGGFLTHSGWNSTLESIMLGMPMISWPQGAEQHLNCRFLVDDLKIAEQLQTGPEKVLKRNEVERVVRLLMVEAEGKAIRSRVEEFQRKSAAAVADGGSQSRFFLEFMHDIRQLETFPSSGGK